MLVLQPQFTTETFEHELKFRLPKGGSPFKGLAIAVRALLARNRQQRPWVGAKATSIVSIA